MADEWSRTEARRLLSLDEAGREVELTASVLDLLRGGRVAPEQTLAIWEEALGEQFSKPVPIGDIFAGEQPDESQTVVS